MTNGYDRYCIKRYSVFHDGIYDTEIGFSFQMESLMRANDGSNDLNMRCNTTMACLVE